ncbi:MAG: hypothetical protein IKJ23_03735 [Bacteroidaceae bacterium]|nr:hypothetical protein [Bacteroidaceae bacterium]
MRIMLTCRYLITTMFICIVMQNGYSVNHKMNIMCDSIVTETKTYKLLLDEYVFATTGLKKATQLETTIQYHLLMQECCPKSYLEAQVAMFTLDMITNYYLSDIVPYDTTFISENNKRLEDAFRERFKNVDFAEYDRERYVALANDTMMVRMKRSDYWEAVFKVNREYANPEGFADVEKAIKELHSRLGLDWDETIFVAKSAIERHRAAVKHIFTNLKDEINRRYIK